MNEQKYREIKKRETRRSKKKGGEAKGTKRMERKMKRNERGEI